MTSSIPVARAAPQVLPPSHPRGRQAPTSHSPSMTSMTTMTTMTCPPHVLQTRAFSSAPASDDAAIFDVTEQNFAQMVQQRYDR